MRSRFSWWFALLAAGQLLACSGDRRSSEPKAPSQLAARFRFDGPAIRWVIQRGSPEALVHCSEASAGERFCVGKAGELWRDAAPKAVLLGQWAPEDLTDIWYAGTSVRLLSASGTVYELDETRQRIARALTPKERWAKTIRVGRRLLALDIKGQLMQSDDVGASWQTAPDALPRGFDLASDRQGRVVLLSAPERVDWSSNEGRSFERLPRPPEGATALGRDADGQLRLYSLLHEPARLLPDLSTPVSVEENRQLRHPVAEYLGASDYVEGRVAEGQGDSLVLRKTDVGWSRYRGRIGVPLEGPWPVDGLRCSRVRLIAARKSTFAVCSQEPRAAHSSRLTLWESRDEGGHFELVSARLSGAVTELVGLGLVGSEDFLLSGICVEDDPKDGREGPNGGSEDQSQPCLAKTVIRVSVGTDAKASPSRIARFEPVRLPPLLEPADAMAQTKSGSVLAIVAVAAKSRQLTLFKSRDGAAHFSTVPLTLGKPVETRRVASEPSHRFAVASLAVVRARVVSLSLAEEGTATLVAKLGDRPTLVTVEADGTLRAVAQAPLGTSQLGASDQGALALSVTESRLYETTNQGAEFLPIATATGRPLCGPSSCAVVCRDNACVVGDRLSRLGFGPGPTLLAPFEVPSLVQKTKERAKGGYECRLAKAGFQSVKGSGPLPNALTAGFDKTAFYWLGGEPQGKNLTLARVRRGAAALESERVFTGTSSKRSAIAQWRGPTGWAAARVVEVGAPSDSIGWVDFRWENVGEERAYRQRVRFSELIGARVSHATASGMVFSPTAMTVVDSSLVVELGGGKPKGSEDAYLLSERAPARRLSFPRWPVPDYQDLDYLLSAGKLARVAFDRSGSVLLYGQEGAMKADAMTVMPPPAPGREQRATLGYLGRQGGVFVPSVPFGFISLADGVGQPNPPPPTLKPLPDGYRLPPCSQEQRSQGARYLVPSTPGTGLPLRIDPGDGSTLWLTTGRSVLYHSAGSVCWDLVEASDETHQYSALLFGEAPAAPWLFRQSGESSGGAALLYSTLDCKRDESLEFPTETLSARGGVEPMQRYTSLLP